MDDIQKRAQGIKLFITDVDGVLTDGALIYDAHGVAIKAFHVHDGLGLKLLMDHGIEVAVITTCKAQATIARMRDLGVKHVYTGIENKVIAYEALLNKLNLTDADVAYAGDDLPDLPLIRRASLGIAVANATPLVLKYADWITERRGGQCAVREICERLLAAQNHDAHIEARYQ
ncbi:MAG: KdsC family phosphatase [Gammaproteobacteria bacterium]